MTPENFKKLWLDFGYPWEFFSFPFLGLTEENVNQWLRGVEEIPDDVLSTLLGLRDMFYEQLQHQIVLIENQVTTRKALIHYDLDDSAIYFPILAPEQYSKFFFSPHFHWRFLLHFAQPKLKQMGYEVVVIPFRPRLVIDQIKKSYKGQSPAHLTEESSPVDRLKARLLKVEYDSSPKSLQQKIESINNNYFPNGKEEEEVFFGETIFTEEELGEVGELEQLEGEIAYLEKQHLLQNQYLSNSTVVEHIDLELNQLRKKEIEQKTAHYNWMKENHLGTPANEGRLHHLNTLERIKIPLSSTETLPQEDGETEAMEGALNPTSDEEDSEGDSAAEKLVRHISEQAAMVDPHLRDV